MRLWVDELVSLEVGEFGSWWVGQLLYMLCPRRCCSHDKTISHLSCSRGQVCLPWTGHMSGQHLLIHREHAVYIRNNMSFVKRSNRSLELVQSPQSVPSCSVSLVPPDPPIGLESTKNCSSPLSISRAILLRISSHKPAVFLRRSLNCLLDMRWGNLLLCSCNLQLVTL